MTKEEAILLAKAELKNQDESEIGEPIAAFRMDERAGFGDNRNGWVVVFRLEVPEGWENKLMRVEVFEPDGKVNIPPIL